MAITLGGGTIHPPPSEDTALRSRVTYKLPSGSTFVNLDASVIAWETDEDIDRPTSTAKIQVTPSFLTNDLDNTIIDGSEFKIFVGYPTPDELWFWGYKTKLEKDGVSATIHLKSKGVEMERREVTQDFIQYKDPVYSGRLTDIAKYIIDNFTDLDSQGIQYSDTKTSERIICEHTPVIEVMRLLADTLGWDLYERQGICYLHPAGTIDNSVTLDVADASIKQLGKWQTDPSMLANYITIYGGSETHQTQETFSGDGTAGQEFELTYPYFENVKVETTADGGTTWVEKKGALPSTDASYDYSSHPESSRKLIIFDGPSGYKPPNAADNVRVTYTHGWQIPYTVRDEGSINKYGRYETTITRSDLTTAAGVIELGDEYLSKYKTPFDVGKLTCRRRDLLLGERVRIIDARNNINDTFTISNIKLQYPQYRLIVEVGNQPLDFGDWRFGIAERVRRLEERQRGSTNATRTTLAYTDLKFATDLSNKSLVIVSRAIGDSFVLGLAARSIIGGAGVGTPLGDDRGVEVEEANYVF
jgi:hypothetical protein